MTRRSTPRPISDSVRALRADVAPQTLLAAVQDRWDGAVGERIAAEARPVRERDGTVTIECRDLQDFCNSAAVIPATRPGIIM